MKDRFKFRVWCENNQEWEKDTILISNKNMYEIRNDKFTKYTDIDPKNHIINFCTGLKDKNGKLIYEGDIVKLNEKYPDYTAIDDFFKNQNYVVEFFQPQAKFLLKPSEYQDNSGDGICELSPDFYEFLNWDVKGIEYYVLQGIEVIGNIYENTELLEVHHV